MDVSAVASPPALSGPLLLGHLGEFMNDPIRLFLRGYRDVGPIFRIRALHRRYVVMVGAEAMRFLAKNERAHFSMKPVYAEFDALFLADQSLISMDGEQHAAMRKLFRPTMARSAFEGRLDAFADATARAVDARCDREHELLRFCRELVFQQLATVMEMDKLDPLAFYDDIVHAMHVALEVGVTHRWPRLMAYLPSFRRARDRARSLGTRLVSTLRESQTSDGLFPAIGKALEQGLIGERDLHVFGLIPFLAGLDTVAASMAFMIAAVYRDPALVASLREEVDAARATGSLLRAELPRIASTKTECLRRYPVTVASIRHCIAPFEFEGTRVEAGTDVMFGISAPLFMEEYFADPFRFEPMRFLGEGAALARGNAFTPFGVGAHACLGTALADSQLEATLATLVADYDITLPRASRPIETKQDPCPIPAGERVVVRRRAR